MQIIGFALFEGPESAEPYFILADAEIENLQLQIPTLQQRVVGYFRTDLRGSIRLTNEDLTVINRLFRNPQSVFLVMGVDNQTGDSSGGFYVWDGDSIYAEGSFNEFPLDPRRLPREAPSSSARPQAATARTMAPPTPPRYPGPKALVPRRINRHGCRRLGWLAARFPFELSREPQQQAKAASARGPVAGFESPLMLSIEKMGSSIAILWNSSVPAVADARIAVVTIREGTRNRSFRSLDKASRLTNLCMFHSQNTSRSPSRCSRARVKSFATACLLRSAKHPLDPAL